jgi:hypothetical protein
MNAAVTMPRTSSLNVNRMPNTNSFGSGSASNAVAVTNVSSSMTKVTSLLTGWAGLLVVLLVLVVLFAVYYQTIGYYIQIGWKKLKWSHDRGETVEVTVPGGPSAVLQPASTAVQSIASDVGDAIKDLESDVEAALGSGSGSGSGSKQVFNVARNLYTFSDAEPLCKAFGAELATYDQVKDAYKSGADWCNYGWVKGQLAVYPTQKATYDKLQHGPEEERMSCGLPGVNGGYFPNADQRFGVNCYGPRPAESALDERLQTEEKSATAFDREVNHFKSELDSIGVNPWSAKQWSG